MTQFLNTETHMPVLLINHLFPMLARSVGLGKHSVCTAEHKVLCEGCESRNNHRHAVVVQDLDTQWSRIRAKQKLLRKPREACKSSWSPRGNQKSFTLTIPWNSEKLVKIFPGIIARLHHTDREQMGLLKEQCAE